MSLGGSRSSICGPHSSQAVSVPSSARSTSPRKNSFDLPDQLSVVRERSASASGSRQTRAARARAGAVSAGRGLPPITNLTRIRQDG